MSSENTFLVELGCEELPPKALKTLAQSFHDGLCAGLKDAELGFGATHIFATPRRLAVKIESLQRSSLTDILRNAGLRLKPLLMLRATRAKRRLAGHAVVVLIFKKPSALKLIKVSGCA